MSEPKKYCRAQRMRLNAAHARGDAHYKSFLHFERSVTNLMIKDVSFMALRKIIVH